MVAKLCAMLELEASEENVVQCKLLHFDNLKAAELKAFIIAHHPKYTKLSDVAHLKTPQGGKSMEEATHGVENCISVVLNIRYPHLVEMLRKLWVLMQQQASDSVVII